MTVVFGAAVGLAAYRQSWANWHEALLVSAICWVVLGLTRQILDLRVALRHAPHMNKELRFGGRLAIAWRAVSIALLAGYCLIEALKRQGLLVSKPQDFAVFDVDGQLRQLLFYLAIILVISSAPQRKPRRSPNRFSHRLAQALAWPAALGLCLLAWSSWPALVFLVHLAITGIQSSFPTKFADPSLDLDLVARSKRFVVHTCLATSLVPLNMWLTAQLARNWPPRRLRGWAVPACLSLSLGGAASYLLWFYAVGLPQFSPPFANHPEADLRRLCLSAAPLLALASAAAGYGLVRATPGPAAVPLLDWRRKPWRYFHERRLPLVVLAIALGGNIAQIMQFGLGLDWEETADRLLNWPENYAVLAAFWLAVRGTFRGWRSASEPTADGQVAVSPWRFGVVWLAAFLTFLLALPLIAWFCFSLWLLYGYQFEWL